MTDEWPKLSETLPYPPHPCRCQACGRWDTRELSRWQEHDGGDSPTPVPVVLCGPCADGLIEAHPRLYRRLDRHEPFPGVMALCRACPLREGVRCRSPLLRSNGGPGVKFPGRDNALHVDGVRDGQRFGVWLKGWSGEPAACPAAPAPEEGDT